MLRGQGVVLGVPWRAQIQEDDRIANLFRPLVSILALVWGVVFKSGLEPKSTSTAPGNDTN